MFRNLMIRVVAVALVTLLTLSVAEVILRLQTYVQLDGFSEQHPWNKTLHHGSGKFVVHEYNPTGSDSTVKVLLLGDSWMEDPHLGAAISKELALKSKLDVEAINGGNSSYAPTLYMLKARKAFKEYGKFDKIVVNIDATDIGDEWVRYRIPKYRDQTGKLVAVPYRRDIHSVYIWNGKLWAEDSNFYLVRLVKFAFYYKVLVPMFYKLTYCEDYPTLMQYVFAPDARAKHRKELKFFDDRLLEMVQEISGYTKNGVSSVYLSYHPHLRGLVNKVADGHLYLPVVSEALARVQKKTGVNVLDARDHIGEIDGDMPLTDTYVKDDPFSHLNSDGATRYGTWIGDQMALKVVKSEK